MTTSKVKEIVSHLFMNQIYHEIGSAITNFMISILLCTRKNTSQLGFPAWMGAGFLSYISFYPVEWGSYISFLPNIPAANSDIATLPKDSNERKLLFWRLLLFGLGGASGMQLRGEQEPSPVKAPFKSAGLADHQKFEHLFCQISRTGLSEKFDHFFWSGSCSCSPGLGRGQWS